MRARRGHPRVADLSRLVRQLGGEVRARLCTARGYPTHPRVTPEAIRELRPYLRSPDPADRGLALDVLRRLILGRAPSRRHWRT